MQHPLSFSSEMCIGNAQTYDALPHILRNNVILNAHKENCKNLKPKLLAFCSHRYLRGILFPIEIRRCTDNYFLPSRI